MERQVSMEEISDGKLYGINDMVKADCHDCAGCSACCRGMGTSILLDPLDVFRLSSGLNKTFEGMLDGEIELNVADGLILPNLKMAGEEERCVFLTEQGRCGIHGFRPGICRIFPLGRLYENRGFRYFLQVHECRHPNRSKVKVKKWIDTPDWRRNEKFIADWHYFLKDLQDALKVSPDTERRKEASMYVLRQFYLQPFRQEEDFYDQFEERLTEAAACAGRWLTQPPGTE